MNVKEFVKTILKDVAEAVDESNTDTRSFVIPEMKTEGIDFDLSIVLRKEGMEISTAEIESQKSVSGEIVNRIRFKVATWEK